MPCRGRKPSLDWSPFYCGTGKIEFISGTDLIAAKYQSYEPHMKLGQARERRREKFYVQTASGKKMFWFDLAVAHHVIIRFYERANRSRKIG
jgi:hypothetical protein